MQIGRGQQRTPGRFGIAVMMTAVMSMLGLGRNEHTGRSERMPSDRQWGNPSKAPTRRNGYRERTRRQRQLRKGQIHVN